MNPVASPKRVASREAIHALIQDELQEVESLLRREMRSEYPFVDELVQYAGRMGGKRLRPALLLLSAKATGRVTREHIVLAAVVEMIHTATLVHDDVLDNAQVRRHFATVNARWDNEASVLLGDFLFTHAFYLASTLETNLACRLIGRATNIVCEGEIRQKGNRGDYSISREDYLGVIQAKTAELCACSCHLGARFAGGTDDMIQRLDRYGRCLGIAFQIADDLLDVLGNETETGKSLGTDLEKRTPTLPIIHALAEADPADREAILAILNGESPRRRELLAPYLEKYDAITHTRERALDFARLASDQLQDLSPSPAQRLLVTLTEFVVQRRH